VSKYFPVSSVCLTRSYRFRNFLRGSSFVLCATVLTISVLVPSKSRNEYTRDPHARNIAMTSVHSKLSHGERMHKAALKQIGHHKLLSTRVTRAYSTPPSKIIKTPLYPPRVRRFPRMATVH